MGTTNADLQTLASRENVEVNKTDNRDELEAKLRDANVDPARADEIAAEREAGENAGGQEGATKTVDGEKVATAEANAALEHSQGGATTRSDQTDVGVPMLQGDPSEPQGPEDALGEGPKRGGYGPRIDGLGKEHHTVERVADGGVPTVNDDGGQDTTPHSVAVNQNARAHEQGEVAGKKGGVDTADV